MLSPGREAPWGDGVQRWDGPPLDAGSAGRPVSVQHVAGDGEVRLLRADEVPPPDKPQDWVLDPEAPVPEARSRTALQDEGAAGQG